MKELISILPEILFLVVLGSAFGITFLILLRILRQIRPFQGKSSVVLAALVALLGIAGSVLSLLVPEGTTTANHKANITLNYYLLPLVVTGGTVILSVLFMVALAISPGESGEAPTTKPTPTSVKPNRGRPKEETEAQVPAPKSRTRGKNKAETSTAGEAVPKTQNAS